MPHPVAPNPRLSKSESRRKLGIPVDGRYIGLAGLLDGRKAISEFLAAFRAASQNANERLLLAGRIDESHLRTIRESHQDLVDTGRVILIKGFVSTETYQTVMTALDVVCTPYPGFGGLSSTLLEGVAAGRPILANAYGWSQAITRRFGLGSTCDVLDHSAFTRTIRAALDKCDQHEETEAIRRLLTFHLPGNYAESWVAGIRAIRGLGAQTAQPWSWVVEAVPFKQRALT
jgi:glycosyltransferase involved in cell wall biosynthesis